VLGFIFKELKEYVVAKLGANAWGGLLEEAKLGPRTYVNYQEYPDSELVLLVTTASRITGLPAATLLEDYGLFVAPRLMRIYKPLLDPSWRALDVLVNVEDTIHRVVRGRNANERPPALRARRVSPDEVLIVYSSPRKLCAVARGIARGVGDYFAEPVTVTESACMHQGNPSCDIVVRRTAAP